METVGAMVGMDKEKINVHVTMLGGAFGRKSKPDFSAEAAFLSMKTGKPIRVQWTREDDIQHGFYHAVSAQHVEAALDENGKIDGTMIGRNFAYRPIVLKNSDVVLGNHYNVKIVEAHSTYLVGEIL